MDKKKVQALLDWPVSTHLKSVQSFLGLANFYRKFIKDFSTVTQPLHDLIKKDTPFVWSSEQQTAFNQLKKAFTSAPLLTYPNRTQEIRIETDASGFALGAVLSVRCEDSHWCPAAFLSKSLTLTEWNWPI